MEEITFPDDEFDIVYCENALDHTVNAPQAVREMIRICKPGGWVYIKCWLMQKEAHRKMHYWNAIEDGSFYNDTNRFDLKNFGFKIKYEDNGGGWDQNCIIAKLNK
jgi:ubiquinone/menaquinone biosynthesis C-methylase UbiE